MKTQKMANGLSRHNNVFPSLTVSDVDPSYKIFLDHLREDGSAYMFHMPNGDHGKPASVRYEEDDDVSYGGANVPKNLSRGGPNVVKRPGRASGRATNVTVDCSPLPRTQSVKKKNSEIDESYATFLRTSSVKKKKKKKNTSEIDESYATFLSLLKIKDGFMVLEAEPGVNVVYEQEDEPPAGYDELRTVPSTKGRESSMDALENMGQGNVMLRDEDGRGQIDGIISEHQVEGPAPDDSHCQDFICSDEHGRGPYAESSDLNACEDYEGAPLALSCGAPSTFDEKLDSVLSQPYDQNEYKELLRKATDQKPMSRQRHLRSGSKHYATGLVGLSYLDHYPDLAKQIDSADTDERRLNLLRTFFFWLENLCHDGAHMPWIPKAPAYDPIAADD